MIRYRSRCPSVRLSVLLIAWVGFFTILSAPVRGKDNESHPMLRVICVSSLSEDQKVVMASRNEQGEWSELGQLQLRSSLISEWLPAREGDLHLALRNPGGLKSICQFTFPPGAKRAILVLLPDQANGTYRADVVNPEKLGFVKGSALLVNFSSLEGVVALGTFRTAIKPGQRMIVKPAAESNGMYRMMVVHKDVDGKHIPCYDRYVSNNPDARDILFLLPDRTMGLRVFSLSEFGPFD
jgi:hypothetical protein